RGIVAEQRRAIGTDDLARIAHVEEHMWVIEWSQFTLAHELARADLDDRDARRVMEMRNDLLRHVLCPPSPVAALLRSSHDVTMTGLELAVPATARPHRRPCSRGLAHSTQSAEGPGFFGTPRGPLRAPAMPDRQFFAVVPCRSHRA